MEDDFYEKTISVAFAFQRELAYRKKLEVELGPDNGLLKHLVPLEEQFSILCPISDHPNSSTPRSSSTNPLSHSDLHCKEEFPIPSPILERPNSSASSSSLLAKRKEPLTSSSTRPLSHSNLYCKVCNIECSSRSNLEQHLSGHKHRSKLEELDKWQRRWCQLCGVACSNEDALKSHFEGKKHKLKLLKSEGSSAVKRRR